MKFDINNQTPILTHQTLILAEGCIKQIMQAYGLTANQVQEIINEKCERQRKRKEEEIYDYRKR